MLFTLTLCLLRRANIWFSQTINYHGVCSNDKDAKRPSNERTQYPSVGFPPELFEGSSLVRPPSIFDYRLWKAHPPACMLRCWNRTFAVSMNSATKKEKDSSILPCSSLVGNASDNGTNLLVLYHHWLVSVDYYTVHRVASNMSICQNLSMQFSVADTKSSLKKQNNVLNRIRSM